jgi:hypothetical protein
VPRLWVVFAIAATACKVSDPPPVKDSFADSFERTELGVKYLASGPGYTVAGGALSARGAHNHPLWLRQRIPRDARIELDCWSTQPRGDLKIELWGDGASFDPDGGAYMASGYELIFGGWFNTRSIIARQDEHAPDVVKRTDLKVVPNQHYHWKIERKGTVIRWFIDDMAKPFLELDDPHPLEGAGHDHLGFNNWETDTWFDNLVITPL